MGNGSKVTKVGIVLFGFGVSVLFLVLAFRELEWRQIADVLSRTILFPWLGLAIGSYLIGHLVRGLRTKLLVGGEPPLPLCTATNVVVFGYAVNNVLPARLGELARAGMLSSRAALDYPQSLSITFLERILDGVVMVALLAVAASFIGTGGLVGESLFFGGLVFGLATLGVLAMVLAPDTLVRTLCRPLRWIKPSWEAAALGLGASVARGMHYLKDPKTTVAVLGLSLLVWILEGGLFFFMFPAFGYELNYLNAIFVMSLTNLGILIPSSPGYIGPFHFFCMQGLLVLGVDKAGALSYASLVHLAFYIPNTVWGILILLWYGIGMDSVRNLLRRKSTAS